MRKLNALILASALALGVAACGDTGNGATVQSLRAAAGIPSTSSEQTQSTLPAPAATATPLPTETPDIAPQTFIQPTLPAQVIEVPVEVTRIVPATVEVTREVVQVQQVEVTATPDIAGFQDSGIDESVQPCPAKYWRKGRCIATQAQIDAYTQGTVQP